VVTFESISRSTLERNLLYCTVEVDAENNGWWLVKRNVKPSHKFYKLNAWALSESDLNLALSSLAFLGVKLHLSDGTVLTSHREDWLVNAGEPFQHSSYEQQVPLHESFWLVGPPEKAAA